MELRADAASRQAQIAERDRREEPLRRREKRLERLAVVLVIVLPLLESNGRADPDAAAGRSCQMHAQAVASAMRQRIHERRDERSLRRRKLRVLAAARIDREALASKHSRHIIRIQAGGVDDRSRQNRFVCGPQDHAAPIGVRARDRRARQEHDAGRFGGAHQRPHQILGADDAAFGRKQGGNRADFRLAAANEVAIDHLHAFDAVRRGARAESLERRNLGRVGRDDQLAEARMRHVVLRTELVQAASAFYTQLRLERAGRIVEAGVDDAAVVRARLETRTRMAFEQADRQSALRDRERRREAGHAGADDGRVDPFHQADSTGGNLLQFLAVSMSKRALITGITGQDGSYLAELLLEKGYEVVGMVRRSSAPNLWRIQHIVDRITLKPADLLDQLSLLRLIEDVRPHELYNLAAMSFVPASWDQPMLTGEFNAQGVTRILDAVRRVDPGIRFYQASSSEMFGKVRQTPQTELTPFYPRSPYGVAKVFAHYITVNYRESYDLFAVSGMLFNHESPRRGIEFVTRKVTDGVARIKLGLADSLSLGNLDAHRDWGFAGDYVHAMWLMLQQDRPEDYIIATGISHAVRDLVKIAFGHVGLDWNKHVSLDPLLIRPAEVEHLIGDSSKARDQLGWTPSVDFAGLIKMMVDADLERVAAEPRTADRLSAPL